MTRASIRIGFNSTFFLVRAFLTDGGLLNQGKLSIYPISIVGIPFICGVHDQICNIKGGSLYLYRGHGMGSLRVNKRTLFLTSQGLSELLKELLKVRSPR